MKTMDQIKSTPRAECGLSLQHGPSTRRHARGPLQQEASFRQGGPEYAGQDRHRPYEIAMDCIIELRSEFLVDRSRIGDPFLRLMLTARGQTLAFGSPWVAIDKRIVGECGLFGLFSAAASRAVQADPAAGSGRFHVPVQAVPLRLMPQVKCLVSDTRGLQESS